MAHKVFNLLISSAALFISQATLAESSHQSPKYITIDTSAGQHYRILQSLSGQQYQAQSTPVPGISLIQIPESQHTHLSGFMHDEYHRCGGFVAHESLEEAQTYLTTLQQANVNQLELAYTIDNAQTVNGLLQSVNSGNLTSTVNQLMSFDNRYYTQQSGVDASNWIKQHWQSIAIQRPDIKVESFSHDWAQPSVIVTISGKEKADEIVIIGGHLDSINSSSPTYGRAPGADDNASGIAVLTEVLNAIVKTDYKPQRTIQIMGFAAEEVGLRGSKAIAQSYKSSGKNVVGMVQFDMVGNHGSSDDIIFMTDYTNSTQNNFLAKLIDTYLTSVTYGFDRCGYGCSDHASWYQQGYPASMPFESRMRDINRRIHTSSDTAFDASHALKFAQLGVAYIAEAAKNAGDIILPPDNPTPISRTESNLSVARGQWLRFDQVLEQGYSQLTIEINGGSGDADLYVNFNNDVSDSVHQCRPYKNGNTESCTFSNPTAGQWFIGVKGYSGASGVTLTLKAQ